MVDSGGGDADDGVAAGAGDGGFLEKTTGGAVGTVGRVVGGHGGMYLRRVMTGIVIVGLLATNRVSTLRVHICEELLLL